ncbi:hypothetical protein MRX96_036436 [Rhipicephalus microplus]
MGERKPSCSERTYIPYLYRKFQRRGSSGRQNSSAKVAAIGSTLGSRFRRPERGDKLLFPAINNAATPPVPSARGGVQRVRRGGRSIKHRPRRQLPVMRPDLYGP